MFELKTIQAFNVGEQSYAITTMSDSAPSYQVWRTFPDRMKSRPLATIRPKGHRWEAVPVRPWRTVALIERDSVLEAAQSASVVL